MSKDPYEQKYKNIPVKPDVYESVRLIAEANGFGERGLGAQIAHWVGQELPECGHEKEPVSIEYFHASTSPTAPLSKENTRVGYYCSTCNRVYERVSDPTLASATHVADTLTGTRVADAGMKPAQLKKVRKA